MSIDKSAAAQMKAHIDAVVEGLKGAQGKQKGVATSLPYQEKMQAAFGKSASASKAQAHTHAAGAAAKASKAMGAAAYAQGSHVALKGTPGYHTAAHEAVHVMQQKGGAMLGGPQDAMTMALEAAKAAMVKRVDSALSAATSAAATAAAVEKSLSQAKAAASNFAVLEKMSKAGGKHQ